MFTFKILKPYHMKPYLLLALLMLLNLQAALGDTPETTLRGRIIDQKTEAPVSYATVTLAIGKKVIRAEAADEKGRFELRAEPRKDYTLAVSMVGYTTLTREIALDRATDLGDIPLSEGVALDDVIVEVFKPVVTSDAEKVSYSVENDPQATGSTLEEIIRKVPQLSIDSEGNVLLNGQRNYTVLLNGHSATSYNNNFKEIIKSMPAEQISRIEVITNPSIKYDAEGVGGLINLITVKKKHEFGYNGSLSTSAILSDDPTAYMANGNFTIQKGKFAMSMQGWFYDANRMQSRNSTDMEIPLSENRYIHRHGFTRNNLSTHFFSLDLSYQPDTLNLLTLNVSHWKYRWDSDSRSEQQVQNPAFEVTERFRNRTLTDGSIPGTSAVMNYEHTFSRTGHTLTLSDEISHQSSDNTSDDNYRGDYTHRQLIRTENTTTSNTFQIDYVNPISSHHTIEAGVKHIYRDNSSPTSTLSRPTEHAEMQQSAFSLLDYRQHILALYAGYNMTREKWSVRLGTRMERTWNDAEAEDQDHSPYTFKNRLFNLVPFISLSYMPRPAHSLSLGYTQRLRRPDINSLSPAVVEMPHSISYGNPDLESSVSHTINVRYGFFARKLSITAGLFARLSNNMMSPYSFADEQGMTISTISDDTHERSFGFNTSLSLRPSSAFTLTMGVHGNYSKYDFHAQKISTDGFTTELNLNIDFALWKEARFMAGGFYNSGFLGLGERSDSNYNYYFGIRQSLFKKKLDLSISATDPFEKHIRTELNSETPTYTNHTLHQAVRRKIQFSVTWRFGHQNVRVKNTNRTIQNTDIEKKQK